MATRRVEIGPTGETVRANVARVRNRQGLTLRDVADRLAGIGRPMAHNTVSEIERGARRVDVDDLMALAVALGVSPVTLLMPAVHSVEPQDDVESTGVAVPVPAERLWEWLTAEYPLFDMEFFEFAGRAWPGWVRERWTERLNAARKKGLDGLYARVPPAARPGWMSGSGEEVSSGDD
ncbi:MAG TPA: helix-turn-helix transcriptional regulator [Mycobacterium sp.]|nr:helix-turn-helix transcriptional regulator [Mycobacterium sp.]